MKKVLVISYYFPPYIGGSIMRIHNFVKYLPDFNFCPIVLTLHEKYYEKIYYNPLLLNEYPRLVKIFRTKSLEFKTANIKDKIYGLKRKNVFDRFFFSIMKKIVSNMLIPDYYILWLPYALLNGLKIIKKNNINLIFSTSPPFSSNIITYLLSKLSGKPFVVDYRDDWIGNEFYSFGKVKNALERRLELLIVRSANKIITATHSSIELFKNKYPVINENKYICIPNGFDPEYFNDYHKKDLCDKRFYNKSVINFTYTGSLTIKRDPRFFLYSIKEIITESPYLKDRIKIFFVGFCHYKHKEFVEELKLKDIVYFIDPLLPKEVARFLQEKTDVCLLFQRESEGGRTAIPGKLYEYLASRKPILCMNDYGVTTRFLDKIGSKLNAKYDDTEKIKQLVRIIIADYQKVAGAYIWSEQFLNNFNRKKQTEKLAQTFCTILEGTNINVRN